MAYNFGWRTLYNLPWRASASSHQVQCSSLTFDTLVRNNKYLFLETCRKSNNVWLHALIQSDCLYLSLFFERYNCILLCDWVLGHCSVCSFEDIVLFGVILFSCIVMRTSAFLLCAINCLACVDCLRHGVGSLCLQPCSEVAVRLTSLMLFHSPYVPARGLVVSASVSVLVGREFDRLLPRPCKLVLQPSYQTHGVRKSCRELTQNDNKKNKWTETWNCRNSVVALQDHCSYQAPTTNHHIKQTIHCMSLDRSLRTRRTSLIKPSIGHINLLNLFLL